MLIIRTNLLGINDTKRYLTSQFKMKDLGEVDTILGIKVKKHSGVLLCANLMTLIRLSLSLTTWELKKLIPHLVFPPSWQKIRGRSVS